MKPQQCLVPGAGAGTERRRTGTTSGSKQESMAKEVHSVKGRPKYLTECRESSARQALKDHV